MAASPKYALIHEWLTPKATGGSELVVEQILRHVEADLFALIDFESRNPESYLYERSIGHTFLQHFPKAESGVQKYLPLLPFAIEQLDLRGYDIILSSSHAVAKGVLAAPQQLHICYCHSPMRYAWDLTYEYLERSRAGRGFPGLLARYLLHRIRQWDVISANRVDYFIANSQHTARRIWRCYRRRAEVIYPPVNLERFPLHREKEDFYLVVARLVSYKRVPLIVRAFSQRKLPLVVIGGGTDFDEVEAIAAAAPHGNIKILGPQPNAIVEQYMAKAKAFIYAACEDFGISLVEAQACGTPVIAYGAGGALETVKDAKQHPDLPASEHTGILFDAQTEASLITALEWFEANAHQFQADTIRHHAERFSESVFGQRYLAYVDHCQEQFHPPSIPRQGRRV